MKNIKQRTIGLNPLEEYLSFSQEINAPSSSAGQDVSKVLVEPSHSIKKQRVTIHVSYDLIEKVKNAVYWEPGLTLAGFAEEAFARALEVLEQERGAPFPNRRDRQLRGGRPIK